MTIMTLHTFVRLHRQEIDLYIRNRPGMGHTLNLNDEDRKEWIRNDEDLYQWARREGVKQP